MQTNIKKSAMGYILLALSLSLFSFVSPRGGDSFSIYLNDKLVIEQYLHGDKTVKNIVLTEANYNDKLSVKYSHCGMPGKGRSISLKDAQDRIVKQWTFANAGTVMNCSVKEIMDLQKTKGNVSLRLCYTSTELPNGYVLVSISKSDKSMASK